ncbi:MAG: hypothetical protein KBG29_14400, partial [Pseudomonadales bacterium]|nr:hypothetical protein [Pseudomonadales bacterium]
MQTLLSGRTHPGVIAELAPGLFAVVLLAVIACHWLGAPAAFLVAAMMVYLAMAALLAWRLPGGSSLGVANRVTLARGVP